MARVVSTIVCSDFFPNGSTACISEDGKLHFFGYTQTGGKRLNVLTPIPSLRNIISVDLGWEHMICLDSDGIVYTTGSNQFGQLGIGRARGSLDFVTEIETVEISKIKQIACSGTSSFCVSEEGSLYVFGSNYEGRLAFDGDQNIYCPTKLDIVNDIEFIACGDIHTFCKTLNGDIYSWGGNESGQLGLGYTSAVEKPSKRNNYPENIVDIRCGSNHSLILTEELEVYICGSNEKNLLGKSNVDNVPSFQKVDGISEIIRIECGYNHFMCIDVHYNLYIFGFNDFGQLGLNDTINRNIPIKHPLSKIIDISSRGNHSFIKTANNEIYGFGINNWYQIGIKTTNPIITSPIHLFQGNEHIWNTNLISSHAKSARK